MIDTRRFWRHVLLLDDSRESCWIWTGAIRDDGRGRYFYGDDEMRAHWAAWEIRTGMSVPQGYRLEKTCAQPQCVRHWKLGRAYRKLSREDVRAIVRSDQGPSQLARRYGVTEGCIRWHRLRHAVLITRPILIGGRAYA